DPRKYVCQYSEYLDHRDSEWGFHFKTMKIQEVRQYLINEGKYKEEEEILRLAQEFEGRFGNANLYDMGDYVTKTSEGRYLYDDFNVLVLDSEWVTINYQYQTIKKTESGTHVYNEKGHKAAKGSNKEERVIPYRVVYKGKKVVG